MIRLLLTSSRPLSWINTGYPFAAAYYFGAGLDLTWLLGTVFFLVPYNLAMYGINDVFDYESDRNNPRKGGAEGAVVAPDRHRALLWAAVVTCAPFLIYLFMVGNAASAIVLAATMFAVVAYSAPRLRFKERPFLDSVTSSSHFVGPAVVGLTLSGAEWSPGLLAAMAAFFAWGVASQAFGAVQDIEADRAGGISSIGTVLGAGATTRFAIAAYLAAGALMLVTTMPYLGLLALPYAASIGPFATLADGDCARARAGWGRFLRLNYAVGFVLTIALILQWW